MKQKEPSGQIKFATYEKYREFCLFIQHKPLVMEYITPAGNFLMDVSIDKLEKSELETGGLFCNIKLLGLSTFYKIVRAEMMEVWSPGKFIRILIIIAIQITHRGRLNLTVTVF